MGAVAVHGPQPMDDIRLLTHDLWDPAVLSAMGKDGYVRLYPWELRYGDVELKRLLGKRDNAQTWSCLVKGIPFAITFPLSVEVKGANLMAPSPSALRRCAALWERFNTQLRNFELIAEYRPYVEDYPYGQHCVEEFVRPQATAQQIRERYHQYFSEMHHLRYHPGYENVYKIYHVDKLDECLPVLVGEAYDGTLQHLLDESPQAFQCQDGPSVEWCHLAKQLTLGLHFMWKMGHVPVCLHLDTILYKRAPADGRIVYMIAGYENCRDLSEVLQKSLKRSFFNPHAVNLSAGETALYQIAAILWCCLFPHQEPQKLLAKRGLFEEGSPLRDLSNMLNMLGDDLSQQYSQFYEKLCLISKQSMHAPFSG